MLDFSVTFIITIINITILFFILRAVLWKPVTKFMEDRTKKVRESIDQAEQNREQAKKLLEQYQARLESAETEAEAIIADARESAGVEAARLVAEGKAAAEAILANGRRQLEEEQAAFIARFKAEAAALVMAATARLLRREFSGEDNRRAAAAFLDELSARQLLPGTGIR